MENSFVTEIVSQLVFCYCAIGVAVDNIPSAIQTNVGNKDDQGQDDRSQVEQEKSGYD